MTMTQPINGDSKQLPTGVRDGEKKKKTVLFVCIGTISHLNSTLAMANHLREQGHRTVYLFNKPFASKLKRLGHEVYDCLSPDLVESPCEGPIHNITGQLILGGAREDGERGDPIERVEYLCYEAIPKLLAEYEPYDQNVEQKMKLLKPDILVIDHFFIYPALYRLRIPWVRIFSPNPLILHDDSHDLPQAWLGLPTRWDKTDSTYVEWTERAKRARMHSYSECMNPYWTSFGFADLPLDPITFFPKSSYLRLYMYAKELDYEQPLVGWERYDFSPRDQMTHKFEVPDKLRDKPGKLIFLSLGSMASADAVLMKRLTTMLADSPHRFIVVTGTGKDDYELPDNMWGDEFLPQLDILPIIDLIITHGGNNTLTESLFFGVPGMLVLPRFSDQYDNAQRIQETGLGIRLDPYRCSKQELLGAIEDLLSRPGLRERTQAISRRMQQPESRDRPLRLISDFVSKH